MITVAMEKTCRSDAQLVHSTLAGDRAAFCDLVDRYEQAAIAVAWSILRSWHDARDAVQDAFLCAFERLRRLWSPHKFGAWVLKIVRHQALLHLRRRASRTRLHVPLDAEQAYITTSDRETRSGALSLICRLPPQECVVVSLRHLNEMSVAEISAVTGRPIGTVTKQLSRAYARMRQWLTAEE